MISVAELGALLQVIMVDLVLAGDNAIVVGLAAAGLPAEQRKKVILIGIIGAALMRIAFAAVTVQLLQIIGLVLAGGLLLLWVAWKLWRELRLQGALQLAESAEGGAATQPRKTMGQAVWQIILADLSMSLDNVLAVAGIARDHPVILVIGLALSVAFMAVAATFIARLLNRHHWIAYVGLAVIVYVACQMIWEGSLQVLDATAWATALPS